MSKNRRPGAFQARQINVEQSLWHDVYHRLSRMTWPRFLTLTTAFYLGANLIFAVIYWLLPGSVANAKENDFLAFLSFSVQTMSTVGYGYHYPQTAAANLVMIVESVVGLFFTAGLTGMVFAKFSAPMARVVFSDKILMAAQNGQPTLSLRLGNCRTNRVYEGRARMTLLRDEITVEGERIRRMVDLKLMRSETPLFYLSWTLYHPVDAESPFHGLSPERIREMGWTIHVYFMGLDEDLGRTIVAHHGYSGADIVRARKFADMISDDNGVRLIDYAKLNVIEN